VQDEAKNAGSLGRPVERLEDASLLTGRALFADDLPVRTGTLHAAMLRSPHAHAEIRSIDVSTATARKGVAAVLTGEDIRAMSNPFLIVVKEPIHQWSLAVERVRYVGEPVAVVVARDRYVAEDALDDIVVDYVPLPAVVSPRAAIEDDAPLVHDELGRNVVSERNFAYGDPDKAFAEADRTVRLDVSYPRNSLTPMECFVVVAEHLPVEGGYDVLANFQGPYTTHPVMALALGVPGTDLRLRTPANSGGSFGVKQSIFPYIVLMCLAARAVGRPVKWVEDRLEHLTAGNSAPNREVAIEAAVTADGKVTALRFDQIDDYGAYLRSPMPGPLYRMHGAMTGAYDIPNLAIHNRLVLTNKMPAGLVRGFGGPQSYFAIERLMHRVAIELGLDPLDVIRRNLVPAGAFPYKAAAGALYDSGDYPQAVAMAMEQGGLDALKERRDSARAAGRLYGIGYAAIVEPGMSNLGYLSTIIPADIRRRAGPKDGAVSHATVSVDPLGAVSATADTTPQGQGHMTVIAQIVADRLGLEPGQIRVNLEHDTQKDAWSIAAGSYSCRFTPGTAVAAHLAAGQIRDKLARIASQQLNAPADQLKFADGKIFDARNPENAAPFHRVAGTAHWSPGSLPADMTHGLRETAAWAPPELAPPDDADRINTSLTYGFVFDFCGVEIDPDTGRVRIDKYVTMHDAGKLLNPLVAEGQVLGSFAQALGAALSEQFVYGEDGSFLSGTFADYLLPTAPDVPDPQILHMETPSPFTPLGAKGIGEGNCMSTPVCIANAVCDALGVENVTLPLTPSKVAALIQGEEAPAPERVRPAALPEGDAHALRGEGHTFVSVDPATIWRTLLDPASLAAVIPGCDALDLIGENEYRADVTLGVGPVRGRFQARVALSELDPPNAAMLSGALSGPLGSSAGEGRVRLEAEGAGTRIRYSYSVRVSGTAAAVGGRMLDGATRVLIGQFFDRLAARVGGPAKAPWWRRLLHCLGVGA